MHPQTEGATDDRRQVGVDERPDSASEDHVDVTRQEEQYGDPPAYRAAETPETGDDPDRTTAYGEPAAGQEGYTEPISEHEQTREYGRPADEYEQAPGYADSGYRDDRPDGSTDHAERDGSTGYAEPELAERPTEDLRDESMPQEPTERAPRPTDEWRLFAAEDADNLRARWAELQSSFVDDPRQAVEQAEQLVSDVVQTVSDRFNERKNDLRTQGVTDTEELRLAVQRYRVFFRQLLGG